MSRNKLKVFLSSILCLLTLSCTFLTKQTGEIKIALPEVSRSYTARNNVPDTDLDFQVKLITVNGNVFYNGNYKYNDKSSNVITISDIPVGKYELSLFVDCGSYVLKGDEDVFVKAGAATKVELELEREEKPVSPDPEVPSEKVKDLTVNITGNDSATKLTYSVTPGDIKDVSITGNSFTVNNLNVGTEYTVTVEGSSDTHTYSGSGKKTISATGNNEINIDVGKTVRKFDVTGNISGVPNDATINVIAQKNGTGHPIKAKEVNNSSYKFIQLPAGKYNISVNGGSNGFVYNGEITNVTVDAKHTDITPPISCTANNKIAAITGTVALPSDRNGLILTAYANNTKLKGNIKGESAVNITDGTFRIENLNVGTYSVTVKGESATYLYEGNLPSTGELVEGENKLQQEIVLTPTPMTKDVPISFTNTFTGTPNLNLTLKNGNQEFNKTYTSTSVTFTGVPVGSWTLTVTGGDDSNTYTVPEGSGTITVSKDGVTGGTEILLTATPKEITTAKPVYYEYETAKKEFNTVTDAVSDIVKSKIQNPITIYVSGNITDEISIRDLVNIIITSKPGENAKITGKSFWINRANSQVTLQNITVSNSNKNGINIADGTLILGDKANIINTSADKDAILVTQKGTLKIVGEPQIDNKIMLNGQGQYWPQIIVNCKLQKPLATLTFFDIKEYTLRPVFRSDNNINMADIITKFTLVDSKYEFTSDGKVKEKAGGNIVPNFKPDPSNRIYCVDGVNGDDNMAENGTGSFRTIAGAISKVQYGGSGGKFTLKVNGPITETEYINCGVAFDIIGVGNTPTNIIIDITKAGDSEPAWLKTSETTTLENVNITTTAENKAAWCLKPQGKTLELKDNVTVYNSSNKNSAVLVMNNAVVILSKPENINADSNIQVYEGSHIKVKKGFASKIGTVNVNLNKEMSNGEQPNQFNVGFDIIQFEDASETAAAAAKFKVIKGNYVIDSAGKIANKPVPVSINDIAGLKKAVKNGGEYILNNFYSITLTEPLLIEKDTIIKTNGATTISRNTCTDSLIKVNSGVSLSLIGENGKTITIDGKNVANVTGSLIVCEGSLILDYCILQNNKDTRAKNKGFGGAIFIKNTTTTASNIMIKNSTITGNSTGTGNVYIEGNVSAEINNTKINSNTSKKNGGGIALISSTKSIPELKLTGNTVISNNQAAVNCFGAGIYVNGGYLRLLDTSKITIDNTVSSQAHTLYFQNKTNSSLNAAKDGVQKEPVNAQYTVEITKNTQ